MRGSCQCGAVRYEVAGPLRQVVGCHCSQCRKTSGHYVAATQSVGKDRPEMVPFKPRRAARVLQNLRHFAILAGRRKRSYFSNGGYAGRADRVVDGEAHSC
ncbi:GFA family protein [Roseovarius litorisediminis]|uniref:GFA family protein n=1 Tax=Roseovarius litorisediminis TaxID=1312363 RepID=UPI003F978313